MKIFKKILNTTINVLIVLVLIVSILVATLALTSKSSGISSIFGYSVQVIMSDSMAGGSKEYEGGDFKEGDVIIGKVTNNAETDKPEKYKKGDIVTYKGFLQNNEHLGEQLICHRIVDVKVINGETVYQTRGDNKIVCEQPDQLVDADYINAYAIVTKYKTDDYEGFKIAGAGKVFEYINSQEGFFLCILLPMIIFFLYVLIKVVIDFVNYKNAKNEEEKDKNADPKTAQMSDEEYEEFKAFMASKKADQESESASGSEDEKVEEPEKVSEETDTDDSKSEEQE